MINAWVKILGSALAAMDSGEGGDSTVGTEEHMSWWREARFGMFIHWGPVALSGREIGWSRANTGPRFPNHGPTPAAEYDALYRRFNPEKFDAREWVDIAKRNGMKYMVLTAKHHDGFLLWDSKTSDYNIMHTPFGRDVVAELAAAAKDAGLPFCVYFSAPDWSDPDCRDPVNNPRYVERMNAQITELLTKYGKIPLVWFDYDGFPAPCDPAATAALCRKLAPGVLLTNRLDVIDTDESHGAVFANGNYATPEQFVGSFGNEQPWETCMTLGTQWSFKPDDKIKDARQCIGILLATVGGDGNLLLNVGPTAEGVIEPRQVKVLDEVGAWVTANADAIYATRGGPYTPTREYASTRTADAIFVHAIQLRSNTLRLPPMPVKIASAHTLIGGAEVGFRQTDAGVHLVIPEAARNTLVTVVKLRLAEGSPLDLAPIYPPSRSGSLAYRKPVEASSSVAPRFMHHGAAVVDDDDQTYWTPGRAPGAAERAWEGMVHYRSKESESLWLHGGSLTVDLQQRQRVARVVLKERVFAGRYAPVTAWKLEALDVDAWRAVASGRKIGAMLSEVFAAPVTAQRFRLTVEAMGRPAIAEFQLLSDIPAPPKADSIQRWRDMRFGMFIHWGPVSLRGTEIGWSRGDQVPLSEYDALYKHFNPTKFDAAEWAATARAAGMKYVVLTTKHHDGFCLWDTKQTDYNISHTPFKRDVVRELADACRQQGLAFGVYYSICDWHHPSFPLGSPGGRTLKPTADLEAYNRYLDAQVKELVTGCGPLLTVWFDVPQEFNEPRGQAVINRIRALQPDILINNRTGARGDYDTPEQHIGAYQDARPWETCMTLCEQWAWKPNDNMKSLETCLHTLIRTAGGDGNLLFNVGPTPEGVIEARQVDRLREMGEWLGRHGDSIYGTRGGPWKPTPDLVSTRRDQTIYLHLLKWPDNGTISLPAIEGKVKAARVMGGGAVAVEAAAGRWILRVDERDRKPIDTIIELTFDRSVMDITATKAD
jgi:alpha-L-fucosidase